jgi:hypothetical protein
MYGITMRMTQPPAIVTVETHLPVPRKKHRSEEQ